MNAELDAKIADYIRTRRQADALKDRMDALRAEIVEMGGTGVKYDSGNFVLTVSTGVETKPDYEKARALYPERDSRMRECLADELKPSLKDYSQYFTGEEMAQFTAKIPCAVKITVKKK